MTNISTSDNRDILLSFYILTALNAGILGGIGITFFKVKLIYPFSFIFLFFVYSSINLVLKQSKGELIWKKKK